MPKGSRRLTPQQRAQRRRRRETGPVSPAPTPYEGGSAPSPTLSSPQPAVEEASAPLPAAVSQRASRAAATAAARTVRTTLRQDPFLAKELQRIGVMSAFILAILVVLTFVLR